MRCKYLTVIGLADRRRGTIIKPEITKSAECKSCLYLYFCNRTDPCKECKDRKIDCIYPPFARSLPPGPRSRVDCKNCTSQTGISCDRGVPSCQKCKDLGRTDCVYTKSKSCECCKKSKVKCDGMRPTCDVQW
ncbi:hypothetical protein CC86DRAFT_87651 [Ophiobolus disseminans]|uniref:Zn(2)-C6 fungal-type domain-containing protein n=1 Tax=Ophiobolus disseminans TaxID=1469910 RepID=A0A6A7AGH7_9PLEO|nr:hypothetical protein CC86DRAFT_87651 [Ophiobolus disseminans]